MGGIKFDGADRISELPELIIHRIMSFLHPKDFTKTSVLSKRWNYLWDSYSMLEFNQEEFYVEKLSDWHKLPEIQKMGENFIKFVDGSLQRFSKQKLCMERFFVWLAMSDQKWVSHIDKFVGLTKENHVKELNVNIIITSNKIQYHLPKTVFATKSLTCLKLTGCQLEQSFGNPIQFHSLKTLYLGDLYLQEDMIQTFIKSCPLIIHFSLWNCWGFKNLHVSRLPRLEVVKVQTRRYEPEKVYVESARLQNFAIDCDCSPCTINVVASQDLRQLSIRSSQITDVFLHNFISKFPNLEILELSNCNMLERIHISCQRLNRLVLRTHKELVIDEIDAPNLRSFECTGNTMPIISSMNDRCKWESQLAFNCRNDLNALWFLKLRESLDNLNCTRSLTLCIYSKENTFDVEELGEIPLPLPHILEHLTLIMGSDSVNDSALIDGLLWCCHPRTITIVVSRFRNFIKALCKKLMEREVQYSCSSSQIKCWRHYLEDVDILNFERTEDGRCPNWNTFLDSLPTLKYFSRVHFRFHWRSQLCGEKAQLYV